MSKKSEFDNILDECLERVLKGETVEACLASYPEHGTELEPLLRTASDAKTAAAIKPRPEFRQRAALDYQAAIREMPERKAGWPVFWQRRWVGALAGVIIVLLAGTGIVTASNNSLPDEPLYAVKLATETVRLALTPSDLGKAELYVEFTDRRVEEIIAMADRGKVPQIEKATERLNSQMVAMAGLTVADGQSEMVMDDAEIAPQPMLAAPSTTDARGATTPTATPVPTTTAAQSLPEPTAPETTPLGTTIVPGTAAPPPPTVVTLPPDEKALTPVPAPAEGGLFSEADEDEQKLRDLLIQSSVTNSLALQKELAQAPESVRAALEKALEVANTGYIQNLSNLEH